MNLFDDFFEEYQDNDNDNAIPVRVPKRYIRDGQDPFEYYHEEQFQMRFYFSNRVVRNTLLPLIRHSLEKINNRGLPVPSVLQLLLTLRFYATGNFQMVDGDLRGISQVTTSLTIKRVSIAIAEHLQEFIHFPNTPNGQRANIMAFHNIRGFPSVAGCVDGTDIPIKNPGGNNAEVFRNRKGQFSLNVQVIAGPKLEILNIVVPHPGSTHDSVIFNRSSARIEFEQRQVLGLLLGDSAYACRPYLLTPLLNIENNQERRYNQSHKTTRNVVERCFGRWKRRFPCLSRTLRNKLETSQIIICATAVLHNIGIFLNDDIPFDEDIPPEPQEDIVVRQNHFLGLEFRRYFIRQHF
ncbi:hypothetical protein Zmor_006851 [Zophobas morio]|uniref:DDE Tnp4 domain-containing protein n=1 Tax=Zophobas morio TaxID=2755281 RepID=A0AA38IW48_9CUCU|nr:hypothetical protein Zmor_006851 [Zophobas morio]